MIKTAQKITVYDKMSEYFEGFLFGITKGIEKERQREKDLNLRSSGYEPDGHSRLPRPARSGIEINVN